MPGGVPFLMALLAPVADGGALRFLAEAEVRGAEIRLADVADLAQVPAELRRRSAGAVVGRIPRGHSSVRLPRDRVAERARAAVPALAAWLPRDLEGAVLVRIRPETKAGSASRPAACLRALKDLAAGAIPVRDDFEAVACPEDRPETVFGYQPGTRSVRAVRTVAEGEIVEAPPASALADVRAGTEVTLTTRVGPVQIRRRVKTTQPGRAGEPVFVRTAEGKTLAVTLGEVER